VKKVGSGIGAMLFIVWIL